MTQIGHPFPHLSRSASIHHVQIAPAFSFVASENKQSRPISKRSKTLEKYAMAGQKKEWKPPEEVFSSAHIIILLSSTPNKLKIDTSLEAFRLIN